MDKTKQPGLRVDQVLLKSARFEHREDFLTLPANTPIEDSQVTISSQIGVAKNGSRGFIILTVKSDDENNPLYRYEIELMALISDEGEEKNLPVSEYLERHGASLLYPFLREVLASVTARGRFGPTWLKPFNIRATLAQAGMDEGKATEEATVEKTPEDSTSPG